MLLQETEDMIETHALASQVDHVVRTSILLIYTHDAEDRWLMCKQELHDKMLAHRLHNADKA